MQAPRLRARTALLLRPLSNKAGWKSWETMMNHYLHAGDFGNQVACAIYEDFDEDFEDEPNSVQES